MTARAAFPPGEAKEDWTIARALSERTGTILPYNSLMELRAAMYRQAPALARIDQVVPAGGAGLNALIARGGTIGSEPFEPAIRDFYLTNPVARASGVMAELSALKKSFALGATGTHG
jgi:NADH-quinone oxidoreductase subunit G